MLFKRCVQLVNPHQISKILFFPKNSHFHHLKENAEVECPKILITGLYFNANNNLVAKCFAYEMNSSFFFISAVIKLANSSSEFKTKAQH